MSTSSEQPGHRWQANAAPRPGRGGANQNRGKLYLLLAGVVVLVGGTIAFLTWPRGVRIPAFLALPLDQHRDELVPPLQFSEADRATLRQFFSRSHDAFANQDRAGFEEELKSLSTRAGKEGIVIYLNGSLLVDGKGKLAVAVAGSKVTQSESWYPLDKLFGHLRKFDAGPKVLLLDLAQRGGNPHAGLFEDDAATRLDPLLREAVKKDATLCVFTSCSPGQVSLTAEDIGHTAFAYFLARGLSGAAEEKKDGRITLDELSDYVSREVDAWAWKVCRRRQVPRVYGGKDIVLATITDDSPSVEPAPISEEYPPWLENAWKKRDGWIKDQSYRAVVTQVIQLERDLLLAERLWRHGGTDADQTRVRDRVRKLLAQIEADRKAGAAEFEPAERASLAWTVFKKDKDAAAVARLLETPPPEVMRKLASLADRKAQVEAAKPPNEGDKMNLAADITKFAKEYEGKPIELASILLGTASNRRPSRELLALLSELIPKELAPLAEARTLKELTELKVEAGGVWPDRAVGRYVQAVLLTEILAVSDPGALNWFDSELRTAAGRLQEGKQMLFSPDAARRNLAEETLSKAADSLARIYPMVRNVQFARQVRDEALLELPSYAAYFEELDPDSPVSRAALDEWRKAAVDAVLLRDLVKEKPANAASALDQLGTLAASLKRPGDWKDLADLKTLRSAWSPANIQALIAKSVDGKPADLEAMKALLRLSRLDAGQRLQLWKAYRFLSARLHAPHVDREDRPSWSDAEESRALRKERNATIRRARLSLTLLRLYNRASPADLEALETELADAEAGRSKLSASFGEKLRAFWVDKSRP